VSETERDSGWSEQYAETGGWPPPAEGQRSYGPGTPPGDPRQPAGPPTDAGHAQPDHGTRTGQSGGQGGSDYGGPPHWGQPTDQTGPAGNDYAARAPWGQPADQQGPAGGQASSGYGAPGQWGQPADPSGQRAADQGSYGQQPWAPGDSAYGRLGRQTPQPPPQQRPRRPWDGRPAPARRPGGTAGGTPVVTITLIALCVVFYIVQQTYPAFTGRYALIPFAVEQGQYARLITSAFLHASLLHLGTNMITLYIVGAPLERALRPIRYLIVYFLSALGGSLFSVWLSPEFSIGVGASGAIFGLFGALVVLRRQVGVEAGALAVLIGLNLVISFTLPNISWQAHIGGLITGTLVALAVQGFDRVAGRRPAS
jgi:membrane associated rhomboid family serine protease